MIREPLTGRGAMAEPVQILAVPFVLHPAAIFILQDQRKAIRASTPQVHTKRPMEVEGMLSLEK